MPGSDPTLCPGKKKIRKKNQNFGAPIQDKTLKLFQSREGRQAAAGISRPANISAPAVTAVAPPLLSPSLCLAPPRTARALRAGAPA